MREFNLIRLLNYVKEEKKMAFYKDSWKIMERIWGFGLILPKTKGKKHQYIKGLYYLFLRHDIRIQSQNLVSFQWKMHVGIP